MHFNTQYNTTHVDTSRIMFFPNDIMLLTTGVWTHIDEITEITNFLSTTETSVTNDAMLMPVDLSVGELATYGFRSTKDGLVQETFTFNVDFDNNPTKSPASLRQLPVETILSTDTQGLGSFRSERLMKGLEYYMGDHHHSVHRDIVEKLRKESKAQVNIYHQERLDLWIYMSGMATEHGLLRVDNKPAVDRIISMCRQIEIDVECRAEFDNTYTLTMISPEGHGFRNQSYLADIFKTEPFTQKRATSIILELLNYPVAWTKTIQFDTGFLCRLSAEARIDISIDSGYVKVKRVPRTNTIGKKTSKYIAVKVSAKPLGVIAKKPYGMAFICGSE